MTKESLCEEKIECTLDTRGPRGVLKDINEDKSEGVSKKVINRELTTPKGLKRSAVLKEIRVVWLFHE